MSSVLEHRTSSTSVMTEQQQQQQLPTAMSSPKATLHTRIRSIRVENNGLTTQQPEGGGRVVVVRYFLDRPGYGLHNAAARLWFCPPAVCTPADVGVYLVEQQIALEGLLVEVYLDKLECFMMLAACEVSGIEWDFSDTSAHNPGSLNIRLTDLEPEVEAVALPQKQPPTQSSQQANSTPAGLFAFSMIAGLENVALMAELLPGTVEERFLVAYGPYGFFTAGLLELIVGIFQVVRGNLYGATAFLVFGCFWLTNGSIQILTNHFSALGNSRADELLQASGDDPWGHCLGQVFKLAFCCTLLLQTFVMHRLSTALITLLCVKTAFSVFTGWSEEMKWSEFVVGWMLSAFAFYVFLVEFTNQVYNREVFPTYKWSEKNSPEEVFGAPGRSGTLQSKAKRLRQASYPNPRTVREALVKMDSLNDHGKAAH
eukprot:scaffold3396_cov176-Amphora_coffeaeformis.AAC.1